MKRKFIDMTNGPLFSSIMRFYFPLVISNILQLLFNATDIIVVGKFAGDLALAAVSSTGSLINLLVGLFIGISTGTNVLLAKYIGANNIKEVKKIVHTSIKFAIYSGLLLSLIGITFSKSLLIMMNVPENVLNLSTLYLRIYFLGAPASLIYNFSAAILRSKGDTKRPLYFLTIAGILNVLLNLFLVIQIKMGVAGVGIATIMSQYISATLMLLALINEESEIRIIRNEIKIDKNSLKDLLKFGIPAGISGSLFSLSNVILQSSINSFGSSIMAGNGAASNIESFTWTTMNGFMHACQSFISQNFGAKKYKRIEKTLLICLIMTIISWFVVSFLTLTFSKELLSIYTDSYDSLKAGIIRFQMIEKWYFLCGLMEIMMGALRGIGYSFIPTIITLFGVCGLRIIWIYTYFKAHPSLDNIYITYPISWTLTTILLTILFIPLYLYNKKKDLI